MTEVSPGVMTLDRDEGRAMLNERTLRFLGMSLEDFEPAYDVGQLDLSDPRVATVPICGDRSGSGSSESVSASISPAGRRSRPPVCAGAR